MGLCLREKEQKLLSQAAFLAEERDWDLRALSTERFQRQVRLAHSLGLLAGLLEDPAHRGSEPVCRSHAAGQRVEAGTRSTQLRLRDQNDRKVVSEPLHPSLRF